ncbi:putative uncharacterized protein DDB_G0277003 [Leptidea sinapis]|uniref:putative uncharacterized protein DDB_G0277003 n=1 Tax=Leptidea sinapis TaxID=189913 RepID=UPI0021C35E1F|nr:putative uncharacterized protein DDB_G0277003 [Leptidea sinapis]
MFLLSWCKRKGGVTELRKQWIFNMMKNETVVNKLVKLFYKGCHNLDLSVDEVENLTWKDQELLLNLTVKNDLFTRYPVSSDFCRLYFKRLISLLENCQEIHDGVYEFMCTVMSNANQPLKKEFCYKHYIVGNDLSNIVTMRETKNMVVNGTTGMKTWEAAVIMADWILCFKNLFKNKRVLELGSGLGFTSIILAKFCDILSLVLTDCHDDVLLNICKNVIINFPDSIQIKEDESIAYKIQNKILEVKKLDWYYADEYPVEDVPDIIVGTDIVYDPSIIKALCNVLQIFFKKNSNLCVYIACVIRNESTFKLFLQNIGIVMFHF